MTDSPEEEEALDRDAQEYQRDKRAAAWLDIDAEVLRQLLGLPENTEILGACGEGRPTISLLVSSPDIHSSAMRVRAVYSGTCSHEFRSWKVTAKRNPEAEYVPLAKISFSLPIDEIRRFGKAEEER